MREVLRERRQQAAIAGIDSRCAREHNEVHSIQPAAVFTKRFTDQSFQTVAVYRTSDLFLRDRETQAGWAGPDSTREDSEKAVG